VCTGITASGGSLSTKGRPILFLKGLMSEKLKNGLVLLDAGLYKASLSFPNSSDRSGVSWAIDVLRPNSLLYPLNLV
jgi:hypothetical protein